MPWMCARKVLEAVTCSQLRTELEGTAAAISAQAKEHVHADEMILTFGAGRLLERFLRSARRYRLLLAEGARRGSHAMAARLSAAGVPVTVLGSAAVCAVMARVNKVRPPPPPSLRAASTWPGVTAVTGVSCCQVVMEVEAALAGGAALGAPGLHALTAAAKFYSVPVLALCPLHALSPLHARAPALRAALTQPAHALPYQAAGAVAPLCDLVPADHITLYITNL
ncbi:hypothetical protein MSG28_014858 [Choristoneura fumiferana]|uniref:Uncharacterized protein n=1 Tax=Choristoneura fumiferana TaxID=7141 RepID=A0ACC0JSW9_CHOFU|nr:hypothetical protein MSG28_014858 [Choristoneura fumiferana]